MEPHYALSNPLDLQAFGERKIVKKQRKMVKVRRDEVAKMVEEGRWERRFLRK